MLSFDNGGLTTPGSYQGGTTGPDAKVPTRGVEPPIPYGRALLRRMRMPVPPRRHGAPRWIRTNTYPGFESGLSAVGVRRRLQGRSPEWLFQTLRRVSKVPNVRYPM